MDSFVDRAKRFALRAHEGLFRENAAREPYSVHIEEVADLVMKAGGNPEEVAAAWLHDVVEDTGITLDQLRTEFGEVVAEIVHGLTDPPEFEGMPTLDRKMLQAKRVATESDSVKLVKIADQTSNTRSVAVDPPVGWNPEKCVLYVEGARRIVAQCQGVSIFLEAEFAKAHQASTQRWGEFSG